MVKHVSILKQTAQYTDTLMVVCNINVYLWRTEISRQRYLINNAIKESKSNWSA